MPQEIDQPRVQFVHKPTSPRTGIGRYATEIERGIRESGADVRVAALKNPRPLAVISMAARARYDLRTFFQSYPVRADLRNGYVTHLTSQSLGTLLLTQRLPRPAVVTVHDILPYALRNDHDLSVYQNRAQRWMDALAMRGLKRADRLIADSHYTKSTIVDVLGIPSERIDVVHLGIDTEHFKPQHVPESFRQRFNLPEGRRYILYVGSEDPRKEVPTLLLAFAIVRKQFPDATFIKIGAPAFSEQRRRHLKLCQELGITGDVRWFDDVFEADLPFFYNIADVFAFPSKYEGFGFPLLEALACGTPVVAVRASSVPELAGENVPLLNNLSEDSMAEAICQVFIVKPRDVTSLIRQAHRFPWHNTVSSLLDIYTQLNTTTHAEYGKG